jgi:hypothetical protein
METINEVDNFYFDFCDKFYDDNYRLSDGFKFNPKIPLKIYKKYFPMIPQSYFFELNNKIIEILINKYGDNNGNNEQG